MTMNDLYQSKTCLSSSFHRSVSVCVCVSYCTPGTLLFSTKFLKPKTDWSLKLDVRYYSRLSLIKQQQQQQQQWMVPNIYIGHTYTHTHKQQQQEREGIGRWYGCLRCVYMFVCFFCAALSLFFPPQQHKQTSSEGEGHTHTHTHNIDNREEKKLQYWYNARVLCSLSLYLWYHHQTCN